jgi:hypothetical protein
VLYQVGALLRLTRIDVGRRTYEHV